MKNATPSAMPYRPDIDGLRAIAVISVVIFHAIPSALPGGFLGVDIFFVISGYLIGGILLRELLDMKTPVGVFFLGFYARRARRILPALMVVVVVCMGLSWFILTQEEMIFFLGTARAAIIGLSNVIFWRYTNYFGPVADEYPLLMTWSLGVEEQFYFVVPLLLFALVRIGRGATWSGILLIFAISFAASAWLSVHQPSFAFYMLPTRAWELAAGVLLAQWHRTPGGTATGERWANGGATLGVVLIVSSFFWINEEMPIPGYVTLVPIVGTVLLLHFRQSWLNRSILTLAPMVGIGLISYSWYLWHWPLMAFARISTPAVEPAASFMLAIAIISGAVGYLSWKFIERPFRHQGSKPFLTVSRYGVAAGMLIVVATGLKVVDGYPDRLPETVHGIEKVLLAGRGDCLVMQGDSSLNQSEACHPTGNNRAIAVMGDSHASALGPGLKEFAEDNGIRLVQVAKSSCPPVLGMGTTSPDLTSDADCIEYMERAVVSLEKDDSIDIVIMSGFWPDLTSHEMERFRQNLHRTIQRLVASGKEVVLIGDVPSFNLEPPKIELASAMPMRALLVAASALFSEEKGEANPPSNIEDALQAEAQASKGVFYKSLRPLSCDDEDVCTFSNENGLLYVDRHHLSIVGSKMVDWSEIIDMRSEEARP